MVILTYLAGKLDFTEVAAREDHTYLILLALLSTGFGGCFRPYSRRDGGHTKYYGEIIRKNATCRARVPIRERVIIILIHIFKRGYE